MGIVHVTVEVCGPTEKCQDVRMLVDSGATYSVLPHDVWQALDLQPKRKMSFSLADGTSITRSIAEAFFRFEDVDGWSPVVLGEAADEALLGVVTLETLGLVLHPFDRTLRPMRMMLA